MHYLEIEGVLYYFDILKERLMANIFFEKIKIYFLKKIKIYTLSRSLSCTQSKV